MYTKNLLLTYSLECVAVVAYAGVHVHSAVYSGHQMKAGLPYVGGGWHCAEECSNWNWLVNSLCSRTLVLVLVGDMSYSLEKSQHIK